MFIFAISETSFSDETIYATELNTELTDIMFRFGETKVWDLEEKLKKIKTVEELESLFGKDKLVILEDFTDIINNTKEGRLPFSTSSLDYIEAAIENAEIQDLTVKSGKIVSGTILYPVWFLFEITKDNIIDGASIVEYSEYYLDCSVSKTAESSDWSFSCN
jgi:hypothetical protein